ncbi:peptidase [Candidatus Nitrosotenuis sp. DW1]|nr:peptidase [Candidatus Nitrosotenuis sp. DW1]
MIPLYASANAASNPNLIVSAENPAFGNHFSGSMVVEVIVSDNNISDTSEGKGEPDVTINGNNLRMVQATDGRWYGYFANVDKAKAADQISFDGGVSGVGFDFGVFCSRDTTSLGPTFTESAGIAVPRSITGATNGNSDFATCTGTPSGTNINNVVRNPKSINTNSGILPGQIGLDTNAWPLIQLFSFSNNVVIQYNGVGTQSVTLVYDDMTNISLSLDRQNYPPSSHVFATIRDMQLNQDPTARDSWTFNISPQAVFYGAFTTSGANSANGGTGLVNLVSKLSSLGFDNNGKLGMSLGQIGDLVQNNFQQTTASDGTTTYSEIVTFVETEPNTGIFENADDNSQSNIKILSNAPRGQSAIIEYNSRSYSIVSGLSDAGMSFGQNAAISLGTSQLLPGQRIPLTLVDSDQNINPSSRDKLDIFRSSALIPSLTIGSPATLEDASSVVFYPSSTSFAGGTSIPSSVPNTNSDRLVLDTRSTALTSFEKISINLGVSADALKSLLIDTSDSDNSGTNWVNYDFRSIQNQLGISDFSDTRVSLFFGLSDSSPVTLLSAGRLTGAQGFIQNDTAATQIHSKSGQAFLVIDFDASNNSSPAGTVSSETDTQPIVFDLFSFGEENENTVNNAIYRFELKENGLNTGTFTGTFEYVMANQLNQFDSNTIGSLSTISDNVKFFVNQRMVDEEGLNISYSDVAKVGLTIDVSAKSDVGTHSGTISLNSKTFRFGQPVIVRLVDPDLNIKHDTIDIYLTNNNPASSDVDTVAGPSGGAMLEVLMKDIRYKRCTIDGVAYGGLASTGFSLVETGPSTGVFEGVFKLPSKICNRDGTELISSAGGIVDVKYTDFRDAYGNQNIFTLSKQPAKQDSKPVTTPPTPTKPIVVHPPMPERILAPLQQVKAGTAPEMVECREGFELVIRSVTGAPACVYPHTAEKLRNLGLVTR